MSKKTITPLPTMGKSSKKPNSKANLEKINDFIVDSQDISVEPSSEQPVRLKKLRKTGDIGKQILVQEKHKRNISQQQASQEQSEQESPEVEYERFGNVDDQGLKRMEEQQKNKKGSKKMKKGDQKLQAFVQKHAVQEKKSVKVNKPQIQTNLMAMFQSCSQPRKPQPPTSSKMVDENSKSKDGDSSDSQNSQILYKKRQAMMKAQKSTGLTDEEALKIAMMESLKDISLKKQQHVPLDTYSYQLNKGKSLQPIKPSLHNKKEQKKQIKNIDKEKEKAHKNQDRKREKSLGKKKQQKIQKSGILSGLGIVLTGQFQPYSKNKILQLLEQLGAQLPKSITKKTTHLLQGSFVVNSYGRRTDQDVKTTTKSQQAAQKNVKIIPFQELDNFFIDKTGKSLEQHMQKDKPKKQLNLLDRFIEVNKVNSVPNTENNQIIINEEIQQLNKGHRIDNISIPWTQKYKPRSSQQIISQSSQLKLLKQWLQIWEDVHIKGNKRDVKPTFNSFMPSGTINSNAALLSGDAGLGKTTTARLIAAQFGYSVVEYNASDARNKKSVELLTIGKTNMSFMNNKSKDMNKTLIIMDEVDGMSSGDRGGITAIIDMIKKTKVPIICICNDRQSTKIRSLAGHCYDIKFHKPDKRQIAKRLERIIQAQGGTSTIVALQNIVQLLQNDIRQILTYLEVMFKGGAKNINSELIERRCTHTKDNCLTMNHFEATKTLLSRTVFKGMTISQRTQLSYVDSDMVPLMIQQNYLASCPKKKLNLKQFKKLTKATDSFVKGDLLDRVIMRSQQYCLMPNKMFLSCIYPCEMISENMGFPKFTQWLGKFSSQKKNKRLIKQIKYAIACVTPATSSSIKNVYAPMIMERIYQELRVSDPDIDNIIQFMWHYSITPALLNEHIASLQYGERENLMKSIETSKKTKLTKTYNKKCETTKFKKQKLKNTTEHAKYDPVLDQMQEYNEDEQEDQMNNQEESDVLVQKKGAKSKAKKK